MNNNVDSKINNLEEVLTNTIYKEKSKIHKLKTEDGEILVVSQKGEDNSYSFFEPQIHTTRSGNEVVVLKPIEDIFDHLVKNGADMSVTSKDELGEIYVRTK